MYKYDLTQEQIEKKKEELRDKFDLDQNEEIPDEAILVNWNLESTPENIGEIRERLMEEYGDAWDELARH